MPNVNLLLGNNGAGKTTTLKAIALSVLSPVLSSSGLVPYRLIRHQTQHQEGLIKALAQATVCFHEQDLGSKERAYLTNRRPTYMGMQITGFAGNERFFPQPDSASATTSIFQSEGFRDDSPSFFVVGYGAIRRVEESKSLDIPSRRKMRLLRYERVAGLFENYVSLIPLTSWLPQYKASNPGRYKQVVNLINRLLPEDARFLAKIEQGDYLFEINGTPAPFGALSDGYQAYIGWVADLLYHICMGAPRGAKLVDNYGIVLVDEIDLHLHPDWQRSVIPTIAEALPNLQFVFTTHSPIVAGSVEKENLYVMETTADGASVVRQYNESIYGLNAEQILLSPYFNLATTRAANFSDELKTLSIKAGRGDLDAALAFMKRLAAPQAAVNGKPNTQTASTKKKTVTKKKSAKSKS